MQLAGDADPVSEYTLEGRSTGEDEGTCFWTSSDCCRGCDIDDRRLFQCDGRDGTRPGTATAGRTGSCASHSTGSGVGTTAHRPVSLKGWRADLLRSRYFGRRRAGKVYRRTGMPARQDLGLRRHRYLGVGWLWRRLRCGQDDPTTGPGEAATARLRPERRLPSLYR